MAENPIALVAGTPSKAGTGNGHCLVNESQEPARPTEGTA